MLNKTPDRGQLFETICNIIDEFHEIATDISVEYLDPDDYDEEYADAIDCYALRIMAAAEEIYNG